MTNKEFMTEWDNITKIKCFEIEIFFKNEQDYIVYNLNIELKDDILIMSSYAINKFIELEIDTDYPIDYYLEEFYDLCLTDISNAPDYTLA